MYSVSKVRQVKDPIHRVNVYHGWPPLSHLTNQPSIATRTCLRGLHFQHLSIYLSIYLSMRFVSESMNLAVINAYYEFCVISHYLLSCHRDYETIRDEETSKTQKLMKLQLISAVSFYLLSYIYFSSERQ